MNIFQNILKMNYRQTIGVLMANDGDVIAIITQAIKRQLAKFILYGPLQQIKAILQKYHFNQVLIVDCADVTTCFAQITADVAAQKIDLLMKGAINNQLFRNMILNAQSFLCKTNQTLSHVAICKFDYYHKLLFLSDGFVNISPTIAEKIAIINNALKLMESLHYNIPKVAVISVVATRDDKIISSITAHQIANLPATTWQSACQIEGPITFNQAIKSHLSPTKMTEKQFVGNADLLIMPNLESAHMFYQSLIYFNNPLTMEIIIGGDIPIILTSRDEDSQSALFSIGLSLWFLNHQTN